MRDSEFPKRKACDPNCQFMTIHRDPVLHKTDLVTRTHTTWTFLLILSNNHSEIFGPACLATADQTLAKS